MSPNPNDPDALTCTCTVIGGCDDACVVCAHLHPTEPCPYDDGFMNLPAARAASDGLDSVRDVLQEYAAAFGQRVNLTIFDRGTGEVTRVEAEPPGGNINTEAERADQPVERRPAPPEPEPTAPPDEGTNR